MTDTKTPPQDHVRPADLIERCAKIAEEQKYSGELLPGEAIVRGVHNGVCETIAAAIRDLAKGLPAPVDHVTGPDLIAKIAQVATAVCFQAGEPAMELAGMIVSSLAANPEHIDRFMREGTELLIEGKIGFDNGSLTYRAKNGSIQSPSILRAKKGQQQ